MKTSKNILIVITLLSLLGFDTLDAQNKSTSGFIDNLVAYWSFDSLENNKFSDRSGNNLTGTSYGPKLGPGIKNQALVFNGSTDFAQIPEVNGQPSPVFGTLKTGSISVWFKADKIPKQIGIAPILYYGAKDSCAYMFDASNQGLIIELGHSPVHYFSQNLYFTIFSNNCDFPSFCYDSGYPIIEGQWYHFVAVVGRNYNTGYLNGVEMTQRRYNFGTDNTSEFFNDANKHEKFWLGRGYWDAWPMYFKGSIDELKIFNKPLTSEQVQILFKEAELTTGIGELKQLKEIKVFPNPTKGKITFQYPSSNYGKKTVRIYNMSSQLIFDRQLDSNVLDVSKFESGQYIIRIFNSDESLFAVSKFNKIE